MKWSIYKSVHDIPVVAVQRGRDTPVACNKSVRHSSPIFFTFTLLSLLSLVLTSCSPTPVERLEWTTMGTVAAIQARGPSASSAAQTGRAAAQRTFARMAKFLNAHDSESELSRLAGLPESEILIHCDPLVSNCYATAFRLMRESGCAFNPRWRGPKTLDLGAIAKGFAIDAAASHLISAPIVACRSATGDDASALLDLGGNLKSLRGDWKVGIAGTDEVVTLTNGMACATSAEYYRGKHICDGRTGLAVSNGLTSVTVVHPTSAMLADGLSTTLFVLGPEAGERFLKTHYPEARSYWCESR